MIWTKEEDEKLINMFNDGCSLKEIVKNFDGTRSEYSLASRCSKLGLKRKDNWSEEELNILKENYPSCTKKELEALLPNRKNTINSKASELGLKKDIWSEEDVLKLKELFNQGFTVKEIVDSFNGKYTSLAIKSKTLKLGLNFRPKWSDDEIEIIKERYPIEPIDNFIHLLNNRTRNAVISKAANLGLKSYLTWSKEDEEYLKSNWEVLSDYDMSLELNKSQLCVKTKRQDLGLFRVNRDERNYTDLSNFLRSNITDWKKESMRLSSYECVVTGGRFDDIHHLVNVSNMTAQALYNLGLEPKPCLEYTEDELDKILEEFKKIQSTTPYGVCLKREIHLLFHNLYGKTNNSPEQFYDFVEKYKSGLLDDYINAKKYSQDA